MLSDSIIQGRLSLFQFKFQNLHKIFYALYIDEHYPKDTSPEEIDNEYETFRRIGIAKTEAERTQKFLRTNNAEFLIEDDDDFF